ncbi:NAD(P)/FAD-dependent oxidoreductase [Bacillus sp. es.036]|uniref:NAD(P)/FAD-dependent oxidoreductase n=1 Tax=Bacillus sp. es.036 TaxID=1761764 RepID=UPI000BF53718|nr:FAD-dependent oxidoreductase [Bacillus sp. es.036]PFG15343.1 hypothetical protein ATG70_3595 [Bacillus sp. es.036]
MREVDVAIIGGGIAGILAARKLMKAGFEVLVLDKSKSVGGRLATRRIDGGRADHGAQFFTVRTDSFQQLVNEWETNGWVSKWFGQKHARYKATNGMNQLVKNLASEVPIQHTFKVNRIIRDDEKYVVISEEGEQVTSNAILLTPPAPQTVQLLERSDVLFSEVTMKSLRNIHFDPALVCLMTLKGELAFLVPDGHKDTDLPDGIERVVDSHAKGISEEKILTIYATSDFSKAYYDHGDDDILDEIVSRLDFLLPNEFINDRQLKRWRYAQTDRVYPHPFLQMSMSEAVFVAGDAFLHEEDETGKTRIESAVISGLSVADAMQQFLNGKAST